MRAGPLVIDFWTHALVAFELVFPLLIWIPLARPLLLALGWLLWALLAMVTGELTFALMLIVASLAFVPPTAFRRLERHRAAAEGGAG